MVEWARGASEQTFKQSAANSKKEPRLRIAGSQLKSAFRK